ncbi:MAG: hypothetical protein R3C03_15810 [Pirellulaceae bacterium]
MGHDCARNAVAQWFSKNPNPDPGVTGYGLAMQSRYSAFHLRNTIRVPNSGSSNIDESAEFLYLVLNDTWDGDRRGTNFLQPNEIRVEGGIPAVLDGFGDPLNYRLVYRDEAAGTVRNLRDAIGERDISLESIEIEITSNNL